MGKKAAEKLCDRFEKCLGGMDKAYGDAAKESGNSYSAELMELMTKPLELKDPSEYSAKQKERDAAIEKMKAEVKKAEEKGDTQAALAAYLNEDSFYHIIQTAGVDDSTSASLVWEGTKALMEEERKKLGERGASKEEVKEKAITYLAAVQRFLLGPDALTDGPEPTTEEQLIAIKEAQGKLSGVWVKKEEPKLYDTVISKYGGFPKAKRAIAKLEVERVEYNKRRMAKAHIKAEEELEAQLEQKMAETGVIREQSYASVEKPVEASDWDEEDKGFEPKADEPAKPKEPTADMLEDFKMENGERKVLYELNRRGSESRVKLAKETGTSEVHMKSAYEKLKKYGLITEGSFCGSPEDTWHIETQGRRAAIAAAMDGYEGKPGWEHVGPIEDLLFTDWNKLVPRKYKDRKGNATVDNPPIELEKKDIKLGEGNTVNGVNFPPREYMNELVDAGFIEMNEDSRHITIKRKVEDWRKKK